MKKVIILISAMALSLSLANAQQVRNGTGGEGLTVNDGSGPYGNRDDMWANISEAVQGNEAATTALAAVNQARETLAAARIKDADMTVEQFQEAHQATIKILRDNIAIVRNAWRENRTDRPTPVVDGTYQNKFRANAGEVLKTRTQLREMMQTDPNSEECVQLRAKLAQQLGERKQLIRDQRRSGGRQSGDGSGTGG